MKVIIASLFLMFRAEKSAAGVAALFFEECFLTRIEGCGKKQPTIEFITINLHQGYYFYYFEGYYCKFATIESNGYKKLILSVMITIITYGIVGRTKFVNIFGTPESTVCFLLYISCQYFKFTLVHKSQIHRVL